MLKNAIQRFLLSAYMKYTREARESFGFTSKIFDFGFAQNMYFLKVLSEENFES
jgi:hypothetical protein